MVIAAIDEIFFSQCDQKTKIFTNSNGKWMDGWK